MLIAIIGESCVGKSTLAIELNEKLHSKIYTGNEYLKLNKNEEKAKEDFKKMLNNAVLNDNLIYVISEKAHLSLLPNTAFKILLNANIDIIKERFKNRLHGNLPMPVEKMLESKHGLFSNICYDLKIDNSLYDIEDVYLKILDYKNSLVSKKEKL